MVTGSIEKLSNTFHPDIPHIKENLELTLNASKKMERFISAVKRQIRVEDFKEMFVLNAVIEDVIILFQHKAMKAGVHTIFEAKIKIYSYQNPLRFQQVIGNLISNAIDAYEGTSPTLHKKVQITLSLDQNNAIIKVKDWGKGIAKEHLQEIYTTFFTTKSRHDGMGLGLSTAKRIVEKDLRGSISVESQIGVGTLFTITFPLSLNESKLPSSQQLHQGP